MSTSALSTIPAGGQAPELSATIRVHLGTESPRNFTVRNESSTFVGSEANCGIQLRDKAVSPKHCLLRMIDGTVSVRDWLSKNGTIVNGQRISNPVDLGPTDAIDVGPFKIQVVTHAAKQTGSMPPHFESTSHDTQQEPSTTHDEPTATEQFTCAADPVNRATIDSPPSDNDPSHVQLQLNQAREEIEQLRSELEYQLSIQLVGETNGIEKGSVADQEIELLQEEIHRLQQELTQREEELQTLAANPGTQIEPENGETSRLVERLEELLDELQSADQRVLSLEDLLRSSDEAHQAEIDERAHIEDWVSEIEVRLIRHEKERQAREDQLRVQSAEAVERYKQAESRLAGIVSGRQQAAHREADDQIGQLRQKNDELSRQLEEYLAQIGQLKQLIESSGGSQSEIAATAALKQQVREQELELAQKRAELARQHAESAKLKDYLERSSRTPDRNETDVDVRLRAFREHLREIHEEEKQDREENSLAARVARIWQRMDEK